ncbi:tetratricopeptide repeat protein [Azospira restricta]|uniref:Tetratricopeptide repeat protein n=1 Tax=Azospira restricta TaxID=404405 RepID=A0A974SQ41_9RHOO|nr:tetratricopeptide repeat protein [Azospira restricta]QRJ64329.1 tetratricopeptide repeat protein [Azospira restricta]
MLLQRSKLAAAAVERPRLAPPWSIAVLGAGVLLVLAAIYPHETLVKRLLKAPPDHVTEAYLVNLLRTEPGNPQLRLLLARSQLQSGLYGDVQQTLAPALAAADAALREEALWLLWQSEAQQYRRLADGTPEQAAARDALRRRLVELAEGDWGEAVLIEIARKAIVFGELGVGRRLFARLAARGGGHNYFWYADAARSALASGEHRAAAEFYLIARAQAATVAEQRRYFVDALRALRAGDRNDEALDLAERELAVAPQLADDAEALELLVRIARAARRPDLADKYARRLLRLSLLEQWRREQLALAGFDARPRRVALADDARGGPQLPFDDRIYTLGFEAFLDNRKLDDAWKVAASAVRQAPDHLGWRERLARVSEWTGRPRIALEQWLYVARASNRDEAWQAVLRLAPGLFDDAALRAALHYQLAHRPDDGKLIRELAATYERLGDPQGGLRVLEQAYQRTRQPALLEALAELAERAGDDARALAYWQRLLAEAPLTPARALRVATLYLLRGQAEDGLRLLEQARADAGDDDLAFWRLTAETAALTRADATALDAYRRLVGNVAAERGDYEALRLLLEEQPLAAAQVASAAWRRFRQPPDLVNALAHYAQGEHWPEIGRLLAELDGEQLHELRRRADFLRLSAQYRLHAGQPRQARQELEAALRLAPESTATQQALLWLLIDGGDPAALRGALAAAEGDWRSQPALHDALAAAYQALSLPQVALERYLTPRLAAHRGDFLWLMNYADALEQNQEADRAWRLRRQLLREQRQQAAGRDRPDAAATDDGSRLRRAIRTRLAIGQRGGDAGFAALRELLRLDRDGERRLSPAARDVALGWLLDRNQHAAARGWLWQQYARTTARPLWGEISLALAEDDVAQASELLARHGERLPRYDRINAALRGGDLRAAQSDAFATQTEQAADDPLHLQLSDALLAHSDHLGGALAARRVGGVDEREQAAHWHLALSPRLTLDLALGSIARDNREPQQIGRTPDESYRSARLVWRHADGETRLGVASRDSLARYTPLLLEHEQRLDARLTAFAALGSEQPADESTALRVAGMKDVARVGLRYRPTQRDQWSIEQRWETFSAQTGGGLGRGRVLQVEAAHALRIAPRDLEASVFWSQHRYDRRDAPADPRLRTLLPAGAADLGPDFFLPEDFRFYGIRLSTDVRFAREYTRGWRPLASVARTWHSENGAGYELAAGVAGSVAGGDHLFLGWRLGRGGTGSGGLVREAGLTYRLHY